MPAGHIDAFVKIGMQPGVLTATCEDLLQMRGSGQSLGTICKKGARVEVINTPHEALEIAKREPEYTVVYPAVGFEATALNVAEVILEAARLGIENFCIIPLSVCCHRQSAVFWRIRIWVFRGFSAPPVSIRSLIAKSMESWQNGMKLPAILVGSRSMRS